MTDAVNVDTATSNVGCNHDIHPPLTEALQRADSLILADLARQKNGYMTIFVQFIAQVTGQVPTISKDNQTLRLFFGQYPFKQAIFIGLSTEIQFLINTIGRHLLWLNLDLHRICGPLINQNAHIKIEGC